MGYTYTWSMLLSSENLQLGSGVIRYFVFWWWTKIRKKDKSFGAKMNQNRI